MTTIPRPGPALALALCCSVLLAACGGSAAPSQAASATPAASAAVKDALDGTTWALVSVGDAPVPAGSEATLVFATGTASGTSGCNTFNGPYVIAGPSLDIGPLASTRKACAGPIMALEGAYFAALDAVTSWAVPQDAPMGTQLTLTGTGPKLVFGKPAGG